MTACRADAAERADTLEVARYATALEALRRRATAEQVAALVESEARWKDYRDVQCPAAAGLYAGGSIAGMIAADCRARLAEQRATELKIAYLDWAAQ